MDAKTPQRRGRNQRTPQSLPHDDIHRCYAEAQAKAIHYIETYCSEVLTNASVQRVIEVPHVAVDWPDAAVDIKEKQLPAKSPPHSL
jgi:hypothetical protein